MFGSRRYQQLREASDSRYRRVVEDSDSRFRQVVEASDGRHRRLVEASERRHEQIRQESDERYETQLRFTREVVRRNELAFAEGSRMMGEMAQGLRDLREESRAHTQAILRLLDRLDDGGAGAA